MGGWFSARSRYTQRGNEYRFRSRTNARIFATVLAPLPHNSFGDTRH